METSFKQGQKVRVSYKNIRGGGGISLRCHRGYYD